MTNNICNEYLNTLLTLLNPIDLEAFNKKYTLPLPYNQLKSVIVTVENTLVSTNKFDNEWLFCNRGLHLIRTNPEWLALNKPQWMALNRPDLMMLYNRMYMIRFNPEYVAIHNPALMASGNPVYMSYNYPDYMYTHHLEYMIMNRLDWIQSNKPEFYQHLKNISIV